VDCTRIFEKPSASAVLRTGFWSEFANRRSIPEKWLTDSAFVRI
jgi:hypothetical protein